MVTPLHPNATATAAPNNSPGESGDEGLAVFTAAPVEPATSASLPPAFLRLPDVTRLFGIERGHAYSLINSGAIKSVCLRRPGCKTGVRLVHFQSVRDYLNRQLAA
jgi:predicted DNA-binding transcriptional regulator AlpA